MIRCVVFDFDGTLVLSNAIKREGFFAVVSAITNGIAHMKEILASQAGDRYAIFRRFTDEVGGSAEDLVQRYTQWCEERIVACPARQGVASVVNVLRDSGIRIHINSSTPTEPLREIILRRFGSGYFDGVHGGHDCKVENLKTILSHEHVLPNEIAVVGDGVDDRDAANAIGCVFFGVGDGSLAAVADGGPLINSLDELFPLLQYGPKDYD